MSTRYRRQAPTPVSTGGGTDGDYDYSIATRIGQVRSTPPEEQAYQNMIRHGVPPPPPPDGPPPTSPEQLSRNSPSSFDGDDALLDLEQLEELHQEAEKMKALGNKHMAAQEYARAYNAYSAALQLSPVGPSSHVFLSNRAAALLSLKRYAAAATDARRAVALAPTFGKAHARLGQSLYFLKDYEGAVAAYEEALAFEPDNGVTQTYLEKARRKLARQQEKTYQQARGEEVSVADESVPFTVANSIATDPKRQAAVLQSDFQGLSRAVVKAVSRNRPVEEISTGQSPTNLVSPLGEGGTEEVGDDPDFDEAVRLQSHANNLLSSKQYKKAIERYSAALFLVPDDPLLSPELHLGRAHALNGARRHDSARNDAQLAIKIQPTSEAYSTLAKSLFYMEDYFGAIEAFEQCMDILPPGESLSMFDQAYLRKAETAWNEEVQRSPEDARSTISARSTFVPKLPPPRFVPREKAISSTPNMPHPPKEWPQQSPRSPSNLRVGVERDVAFLSESLGIKLNRGPDGIVRVVSVAADSPGSPLARDGFIDVGDVVREAAGVDIRRPITNIMWGDTVALIKMAPRPIILVVAREESAVPPFVTEEIKKASQQISSYEEAKREERGIYFEEPSPASGMESVKDSIAAKGTKPDPQEDPSDNRDFADGEINDTVDFSTEETTPPVVSHRPEKVALIDSCCRLDPPGLAASSDTATGEDEETQSLADGEHSAVEGADKVSSDTTTVEEEEEQSPSNGKHGVAEGADTASPDRTTVEQEEEQSTSDGELGAAESANTDKMERDVDEPCVSKPAYPQSDLADEVPPMSEESDRDDVGTSEKEASATVEVDVELETDGPDTQCPETDFVVVAEEESLSAQEVEIRRVGGEIVFETTSADATVEDWTNLRWLATSGTRKLQYCEVVMKLVEKKGLLWNGSQYARRRLAIYESPSLFIVLRPPRNAAEVRTLLDLPDGVEISLGENAQNSFLVAETVVDPKTCKLRLSLLTTATSVQNASADSDDSRRRACFELITPSETMILSAVPPKEDIDGTDPQFWSATSEIYLETAGMESAIANALHHAHMPQEESTFSRTSDMAWKHQIIQGTLHSFVVAGNVDVLEKALEAAVVASSPEVSEEVPCTKFLRPQVIDERDESGRTALHYACTRRSSSAVSALTAAGANCSIPVGPAEFFPSHLSALMLDEKSLSIILSASYPMRPDPNALDVFGRTPMYLASVAGKSVGGGSDATSLARCLSSLEAWGGQMLIDAFSSRLHHPVSYLASRWRPGEMSAVLAHTPHRFPPETVDPKSLKSDLSKGALFHYPIHASIITLKKKIEMIHHGEPGHGLTANEQSPDSPLMGTIRILLENGFEPNERLDSISDRFDGVDTLLAYAGFSPLQILASAALDVDALPDAVGSAVKQTSLQLVARTAELLVRNGARLSLGAPPPTKLLRSTSGDATSVEPTGSVSESDTALSLKRAELKIDSNDSLVSLLGGGERLAEAKRYWSQIASVTSAGTFKIHKEKIKSVEADSHDKCCAICWRSFGTIRNRKHRCRITNRNVCEECSSKRIVENGEEHRLSDGQFLVARVDAARAESARLEEVQERARIRQLRVKKIEDQRAVRQAKTHTEEENNRDTLFGGVMEKAASYVFGEEIQEESPQDQVQSLTSKMNQTRDALNQRGEKLNSLSDKTAKLRDSSAEFAKLAKELKNAQKGGLFW